jgi:hypothetical protein
MAQARRSNPFMPLIVGVMAAILAFFGFLLFRDGDARQQAGVEAPPAAGTPSTPPQSSPGGGAGKSGTR